MTENNSSILEGDAGFRVLFQYASVGIIVVNKKGVIILANPCAAALFGYDAAELSGHSLEVLLPDSLGAAHVRHRDSYFAHPKARAMGIGLDLHGKKKDTTVFPVEISLGYYTFAGEPYAVAFITDISKRKEAEESLLQTNANLERLVTERTLALTEALEREKELGELKSRFVSMASHEFRTPLSTVLSSVSLINSYIELGENEKTQKHVERIKNSIKNMTVILDDFLSLDKLEQGKVTVDRSVFNIVEFAEELLEEVRLICKNGQEILLHHHGFSEVYLDRKLVRNIFLNLLSNAIKYSNEGTKIIVEITILEALITLSVQDFGIGIPDEDQKHLFDKFFRAKNASSIQGTGLGLNIVKHYAALMDGTLSFVSRVHEGTTFTIALIPKKSV